MGGIYDCSFCGSEVKYEGEAEIDVLWFDNHFACKSCYMKLHGADLTEIKNILLRIEKKIDSKKN